MSRTIRNVPAGKLFRTPKGHRKAKSLRGLIRNKAIPPSSWEDQPIAAWREAFHAS